MRSIGVIGCGVVGEAVATGFEERGVNVKRYDKFKKHLSDPYEVMRTDAVFVCVPTATREDGTQDTEPLSETFAVLRSMNYEGIIVVKSTVLPGTTKRFADLFKFRKVVHNPEFLTAAKPLEDFRNQTVVLLGSNDYEAALAIGDLYRLAGFGQIRFFGKLEYTEVIKYMRNNYLATKVSFFNEQHDVCTHVGVDYDTALDGMLMVGGVERTHTQVPGPDGSHGYGGMCFPKDSLAQLTWAQDNGIDMEQLWGTVVGNKRRRKDS